MAVTEIVSAVIGLATGLVAGLLTGFYFERRSTLNIRRQNQELGRQLSALRTILYSIGAPQAKIEEHVERENSDLTSRVTARALATQDATGRVRSHELVAYFVEKGERVADIEAALHSLCTVGRVKEEGEWLKMV
jgi:hypothetical protein